MRKVYIERLKTPHGRRFRCRWRDGPGRHAKWQKSPSVTDKTKAIIMRAKIEARLAADEQPRDGVSESLATLAHAWSKARIAEGNHPLHTQASLGRVLSFFARWGLVDATELTPATINEIRSGDRKPLDPQSDPIQRQRRSLARWSPRTGALVRAVLRWAMEQRGAAVDPAVLVSLRPRERPRQRKDLVGDQVIAGWIDKAAMISPDAEALVHVLLLYGWRPITAARLRCADVDLARGIMRTEIKSRRGTRLHSHPLRPETIALLQPLLDQRQPTDPVFLDPRTGDGFAQTGSRGISQWWRDTLGKLGGLSYDAKRYACTRILREAKATEGRHITGHATARQLELYAVTNEDRAREIINAVPALPSRGHTMGTPDSTSRNLTKIDRDNTSVKST